MHCQTKTVSTSAAKKAYSILAYASIFVLTSCNHGQVDESNLGETTESGSNQMSLSAPRSIASARIAPSELSLRIIANGEQVTTTRSDDNIWTGNLSASPNTMLVLSIDWSFNDVLLASLEDEVSISNANVFYVVNESDYRLIDSDGDSFSNIAEIDAGTNHDDPNSFPTPNNDSVGDIFNSEQSSCATQFFAIEALGENSFTEIDAETVIPTPTLNIPENASIFLATGSIQEPQYTSDDRTLFFAVVIQVTQPGIIRISHISGAPSDSFGALYERNRDGRLILLQSDDDSGEGLNSSLAVGVEPGGYCYFMRHLSLFPIQSGLSEGSPTSIRFELLSDTQDYRNN